ncbi:MAG: cell wall metabolism sensor histidine kinase WalK [Kiritimatiellales bacterium]|nr:cell wall metabolism sensor histidine kinase WalK [Kiritimatiellales bacterium]
MRKKHLFWVLLPSYWILTAIAIMAVSLYAFHSMSELYFQSLETDLTTRALLLGEHVRPAMQESNFAAVDTLCKSLGKSSATRVTVIDREGNVLGDSDEAPDAMEHHGNRAEVRQAFSTEQPGTNRRFSRTLKKEMMYVAVPLKSREGEILAAVRASLPMTVIEERLNAMILRIAAAAVFIGLLAMALCIFMVRHISSPLRNMSEAANRYANGDFSLRIPAQHTIELDQLSNALNDMSEHLNSTLSTLSEQRNEQRAVLSSMDEGVLAVDQRERVIHMNRVAGEILGVDRKSVKRELVQQVIRFANLQEFIKAVLASRKPISKDLILMAKTEIQLQARGTVLKNEEDEPIGALIILRDVTHLRHLETVRSDFVANVSHELKTPITSIKGFVETLLSEEWNHSEEILRFLEIINQQTGRLSAIIDDLLTLSRLEQKTGTVIKENEKLVDILEDAIRLCELQAKETTIQIQLECPNDIVLPINAHLLEQAIVNLVINAVKYSEPEKTVRIMAEKQAERVIIRVEDEGFGIENKHLERLFERFYRVDTARSRKLGGTGLGLSIVKHIVQVHEGSIHVESKIGVGSTFTIALPGRR